MEKKRVFNVIFNVCRYIIIKIEIGLGKVLFI